ncbi:hypothetical protein E2C01_062999 [Portunus trituberculatus]|uniref:Uncharacterized protein n=1 Tax=Portunus trituberculatus TaxID=210409 RepID=A0A5B7HGC3_PORTR|nr:hypothetical protein [Portunus trituberculatus]
MGREEGDKREVGDVWGKGGRGGRVASCCLRRCIFHLAGLDVLSATSPTRLGHRALRRRPGPGFRQVTRTSTGDTSDVCTQATGTNRHEHKGDGPQYRRCTLAQVN